MRSSDWSSDVCSSDLNTWTLPAGFMELGETTAQGAMRETQEEAGAQIRLGPLYTLIDVPHAEQVHFFYLAEVLSEELYPGRSEEHTSELPSLLRSSYAVSCLKNNHTSRLSRPSNRHEP